MLQGTINQQGLDYSRTIHYVYACGAVPESSQNELRYRLIKILKLSGANQVLSAFSACSELDSVGLDCVCISSLTLPSQACKWITNII